MKIRITTPLLAALLALLTLATGTQAAIIVSGDIQGTGGMAEITQDITFTITADGHVQILALDEWVTSDGGGSFISLTPNDLSYSINGGGTQTTGTPGVVALRDNLSSPLGDLSLNDGFFIFTSVAVTSGDTFTVLATTWTTAGDIDFNPQAIQTFTGDVFLTDPSGNRLSANVTVPEPGTWAALASLAALGIVVSWRRFGRG